MYALVLIGHKANVTKSPLPGLHAKKYSFQLCQPQPLAIRQWGKLQAVSLHCDGCNRNYTILTLFIVEQKILYLTDIFKSS